MQLKRFSSIQKKILFYLSVLFLLGILTAGWITSRSSAQLLTDEVRQGLQVRSRYMVNALHSFIKELEDSLFYLSCDINVQTFVSQEFTDEIQRYEAYKKFDAAMKSVVLPKKHCTSYLYLSENNYFYSTDPLNTQTNVVKSPLAVRRQSYLEPRIQAFYVMDDFHALSRASDDIVLAVGLTMSADQLPKRYENQLAISVSAAYFDELFQSGENRDDDFVLLVNEKNEILYDNIGLTKGQRILLSQYLRETSSENQLPQLEFDGRKYFVCQCQLEDTPWRLLAASDIERSLKGIKTMNLIAVCTFFVVFLITLGVLRVILKKFIAPINELRQAMKSVERGELTRFSAIRNNDEIGELSASFNLMLKKLNIMINQVYKSRLYQREAELYALQGQINPHFLYNVLGTISSLAQMHRYKDIRKASSILASLFRYSVDSDAYSLVSFQDELQYAQNYIALQRLRFEEKLNVCYQIDPAVTELFTLKLIFQPLIENCIQHGMAQVENEPLNICVSAERESDCVRIVITNNGTIEPKRLAEIRENLNGGLSDDFSSIRTHASIGIYNVNSRIRLSFGNEYGLQLDAKNNLTSAILRLPIKQKKEMEP